MKGLRAGQTERSANSPERKAAPYGVWRSERTETHSSLPQVAAEEIDLLAALDEALRDSAQDDKPPVRISEEGLLG